MKGISRWIKSENLIKKTIKTILSSLRSQNFYSGWQKDFLEVIFALRFFL
jgi:hypothetical protein